ncbi:hypothetical protein DYB26_005546 [Aphanomyces astaci]|uniref:ABC transporter domain-containing protein n=1 Tax=Aphanomyces astaci TaxID=112090 RepID=A0A397ADK4_APHAT|nr:hypothetical protein DYB36_001013 [Aphanomyces astaci]RHZ09323.1 hypothetical protein DYB31_002624 [Aphanomyces astaci]RHZ37805.1 hypothetical protein DYB26_005546 [Aphanomyces astaci]
MVWVWSSLETAMVAPERVAEYTNVEQEAPRVIPGSAPSSWPQDGSVRFDRVSFRYKPNDPLVLKDISFDVKSGEKVGIVGRTGAGKSSLTMALFRINELASGTMKIGGVDASSMGVKTLRESMAIIPQNPILFKGTLRTYTDAELWVVLARVQLTGRIAAETDKLQSVRCFGSAASIVMDEATAAMDHETDQNLQRVIRDEFAGSTVLTIAHRLDTVLDADRIMVFDQGRIVQCDAPGKLIQAGTGIFYDLCSEGGYLDKIVDA